MDVPDFRTAVTGIIRSRKGRSQLLGSFRFEFKSPAHTPDSVPRNIVEFVAVKLVMVPITEG